MGLVQHRRGGHGPDRSNAVVQLNRANDAAEACLVVGFGGGVGGFIRLTCRARPHARSSSPAQTSVTAPLALAPADISASLRLRRFVLA
jgi:hypothetical protein